MDGHDPSTSDTSPGAWAEKNTCPRLPSAGRFPNCTGCCSSRSVFLFPIFGYVNLPYDLNEGPWTKELAKVIKDKGRLPQFWARLRINSY